MNGHLLRCQSALRAHVRTSTLRAQGLLPPCIWPSLNRLQYPILEHTARSLFRNASDARRSEESPRSVLGRT